MFDKHFPKTASGVRFQILWVASIIMETASTWSVKLYQTTMHNHPGDSHFLSEMLWYAMLSSFCSVTLLFWQILQYMAYCLISYSIPDPETWPADYIHAPPPPPKNTHWLFVNFLNSAFLTGWILTNLNHIQKWELLLWILLQALHFNFETTFCKWFHGRLLSSIHILKVLNSTFQQNIQDDDGLCLFWILFTTTFQIMVFLLSTVLLQVLLSC
jgi:hypothetical protein